MTGSFAVDVFRGSGCLSDMICDIWRFEPRDKALSDSYRKPFFRNISELFWLALYQ